MIRLSPSEYNIWNDEANCTWSVHTSSSSKHARYLYCIFYYLIFLNFTKWHSIQWLNVFIGVDLLASCQPNKTLLPLTSYELKFSSRFEWTSAYAWLHFTVVFRLSQSLLFHPILSLTSFPFAHLFSHSDKYMLFTWMCCYMNAVTTI